MNYSWAMTDMDSHQFSDADEEEEIPYKVLMAEMLQTNQLETELIIKIVLIKITLLL